MSKPWYKRGELTEVSLYRGPPPTDISLYESFSIVFFETLFECCICRAYNGTRPTLTIGDPEIVKVILVKDFHVFTDKEPDRFIHPIISKSLVLANGDDWKRLRSIVSPTFSSGKMKKMYPLVKEGVDELVDYLDALINRDGITILDARDTFSKLTMQVEFTAVVGNSGVNRNRKYQ